MVIGAMAAPKGVEGLASLARSESMELLATEEVLQDLEMRVEGEAR